MALAAAAQWPDLLEEGPLILEALAAVGVDAATVVWNDPAVAWSSYDLVVANGAWDNIRHVAEFVSWTERLERAGVAVVNSPATLRWNLDKRYLRDLEAAGVPVVPTTWITSPGPGELGAGEVVVKPTISGGGHQTARYEAHEHEAARRHIDALVASGGAAMVQPYEPAVDDEGEIGLVFLGGEFSHAIHKGPMIRRGAGPLDHLIDNQVIAPATASAAQVMLGHQALDAATAVVGRPTYARVDTVTGGAGTPVLLELELLDPMLFFAVHPDRAPAFARVLATALAEAPGRADAP